jgi:hypothetical protein
MKTLRFVLRRYYARARQNPTWIKISGAVSKYV